MALKLGELAQRHGLELAGAGDTEIRGVCGLHPGQPGCITFLANPKLRPHLAGSRAAAVILRPRDAQGYAGNALVAKDPYLAFARIAAHFDTSSRFTPGVHPSAQVAPGVIVPASAHVGPLAVIEAGAQLGEGAFIGPHCVVGAGARIGAASRLEARVWVGAGVRIGARVRLNPGVVVGGRGFGLARGPQGWEEVPQLGSVVLGDDVEVGANTTIDRGAVDDTVLANGVKLDNQIQVAHNVRIGEHTAIAACVGIAGSTTIGSRCMIGGAATINGHIEIGDDALILGFAMVTKSVPAKGQVGSGIPAEPVREWRRQTARIKRLPGLIERLEEVERRLGIEKQKEEPGDEPDV